MIQSQNNITTASRALVLGTGLLMMPMSATPAPAGPSCCGVPGESISGSPCAVSAGHAMRANDRFFAATQTTNALSAVLASVVAGLPGDQMISAPHARDASVNPLRFFGPKVIIANRNAGTVSVIDAKSDRVIGTFDLPPAANTPEPMYVNYTNTNDAIWVGDRANDRMLVYQNNTGRLLAEIPTGSGVFHQWADPVGGQMWVVNDIDKSATVIDVETFDVLATVPMPTDLSGDGERPHDVIIDADDSFAIVSILRADGADFLVRFDTTTFEETGRVQVGDDPHLTWSRASNLVYSPNQLTSNIYIFDPMDPGFVPMDIIDDVPGAHGAGMSFDGNRLYVSNISGGGTDALWFVDTDTSMVMGTPADTPVATPHNIAVSPFGNKLWVTHSGADATAVTVFEMTPGNPMPMFVTELETDLNPFGLALTP
ncbi:MAG: YncE family protein [Planctomycetota bacterium]